MPPDNGKLSMNNLLVADGIKRRIRSMFPWDDARKPVLSAAAGQTGGMFLPAGYNRRAFADKSPILRGFPRT